jgi:hypothetical protein
MILATMGKLATYVAAILRRPSSIAISKKEIASSSWRDQGFEVSKETTHYHFDNGVVVRRTVEQDNFPSEAACAECWISYEVVGDGNRGVNVTPVRIVFNSTCRESFWLKYHST